MKVFEVITEHCEGDSNKIITTRQHVTSEKNTLLSVVEHFDLHCKSLEMELMSVREAVVVSEHIESTR